MWRRGPDFATYRRWRANGDTTDLLFTRLSIIDLDPRANQPLNSGTQWMVCNGELYNYQELRRELEGAGHQFRTQSDVALAAGLSAGVALGVLLTWAGTETVKRGTQRIDRAFFRSAYDARRVLEHLAELPGVVAKL